jgi:predicted nucleic acid-binding protein
MANKAQDINRFSFSDKDQLLLDTSVWMRVYGPAGPTDRRVAIYSGALRNMLTAKSPLFVDVLVVSEFVNAYARLRQKILLQDGAPISSDFKTFRSSPAFAQIAKEICDAVRRIVGNCTRTGTGFETTDITDLLTQFEKGAADFNDHMLGDMCRLRGWTLVTDDADLQCVGVPLITANRRLLRG